MYLQEVDGGNGDGAADAEVLEGGQDGDGADPEGGDVGGGGDGDGDTGPLGRDSVQSRKLARKLSRKVSRIR